jgi:myo-inositol-1(or 4)-monophosphatase
MTPSSDDLARFLSVATEAAKTGGAELLRMMGTAAVREKGKRDFVTEADLASQQAIEKMLTDAFPDHRFLGEEDDPALNKSVMPQNDSESPYCWVVDPLDGTTNFVHQLPSFSVSIGLLHNGVSVVGVVWDPVLEELYHATAGGGAFKNGQPISVSDCDQIDRAMVIISFAKGVGREDQQVQQFLNLLEQAGTIRRLGSAALNLCYVASGCSDSYWANNLKVWDIAAGSLIAVEAGATIKKLDGQPLDLMKPNFFCAANETLFQQGQEVLAVG